MLIFFPPQTDVGQQLAHRDLEVLLKGSVIQTQLLLQE